MHLPTGSFYWKKRFNSTHELTVALSILLKSYLVISHVMPDSRIDCEGFIKRL